MIQALPTLAAVGAPPAADQAGQEKLKSAAQAFEAVFLRQMLGTMRSASLGDGMFDSQATEQFQSMADGKTADSMSEKGVLGIAEMLVKQLGPVVPHAAAASTAVDVAGRVGHVAGDLVSRFKL